jgi:hypothetical protein
MASGIIREGWLNKSPPDHNSSVKKWRNRWFVLRRNCKGIPVLQYYEDKAKKKFKKELELIGNVELAVVPDYGRGHKFVFCIVTTSRRMFMAAPSQ